MTRANKEFIIRSNVSVHGVYYAWKVETGRLMRTIGHKGMTYEHRRSIKRQAYYNVKYVIDKHSV